MELNVPSQIVLTATSCAIKMSKLPFRVYVTHRGTPAGCAPKAFADREDFHFLHVHLPPVAVYERPLRLSLGRGFKAAIVPSPFLNYPRHSPPSAASPSPALSFATKEEDSRGS